MIDQEIKFRIGFRMGANCPKQAAEELQPLIYELRYNQPQGGDFLRGLAHGLVASQRFTGAERRRWRKAVSEWMRTDTVIAPPMQKGDF
jgi:hypothetical protein